MPGSLGGADSGQPAWFNHGDPRGAGLYGEGSGGGSNPFFGSNLPPGVTPNSTPAAAAAAAQAQQGSSLSPNDAATIVSAAADKISRQSTHSGIEFATVISVSVVQGQTTHAQIHVDGATENSVSTVPVIAQGVAFYSGLRVAIQWVNPHGCYIIGTAESNTTPAGRISFDCGGGSEE